MNVLLEKDSKVTMMNCLCVRDVKVFFKSKQIYRHKKRCSEQNGTSYGSCKFADLTIRAADLGVSETFKVNILNRFRHNAVGEICRTDKAVLMLGEKLWSKSAKKERHVIMSEMRLLANIILGMRSIQENDSLDGRQVLVRDNFLALEQVIEDMSKKECGSLKAGLKLKIGYLLKKLIKVLKGHYIQINDMCMAEETTHFASLLDLNWDFTFYTAQLQCEQRRNSLRKPQEMPNEEDLRKLKDFIVTQMTKLSGDAYKMWDLHDFVFMRNLIVSRLTIFNARRGGEPARLTLKEWKDAMDNVWINPQQVQQMEDPLERAMVDQYKLAYQAGKGSRKLVPILVPKDTILPLQKLVDARQEFEIPKSNPFVFPTTGGSDNHALGWHSIKKIVDIIHDQLEKPSLLISDKFRHRVSTLFALLELPAEERSKFYRHMGHSESMNTNVYQCPHAIGEIVDVGRYLQRFDTATASTSFSTGTTKETEQLVTVQSPGLNFEKGNESTATRVDEDPIEQQEASIEIIIEPDSTVTGSLAQPASTVTGSLAQSASAVTGSLAQPASAVTGSLAQPASAKTVRSRRYQKWSDKDTKLVRAHFSEFVFSKRDNTMKGSLPSKKRVTEFITQNQLFEKQSLPQDVLISLVKTKVFNERKKEQSRSIFKTV